MMDRTLFASKLATTTEQLALVERALGAIQEPSPALGTTHADLQQALRGLAELKELFGPVDAPTAMRACTTCNKMIVAAATLCGHCWTKTTPVVA